MSEVHKYKTIAHMLAYGHGRFGKIGQRVVDDDGDGDSGIGELGLPVHPLLGDQRQFDGIDIRESLVTKDHPHAEMEFRHTYAHNIAKQMHQTATPSPKAGM